MKEVTEMPTDGQFVAVYSYSSEVWSGTYKWDDDLLITEYCLQNDEFEHVGGSGDVGSLPWVCNTDVNVKFFGGK